MGIKEFLYDNIKYQIDNTKTVGNGGDIDENTFTIFVDKGVPEKFLEGIAVHEIEERKLLKKGHSYVFSHNEAQKKEAEFYEKVYGKDNGVKVLEEEERVILTITHRRSVSKKSKIISQELENVPPPVRPIIDIDTIKQVTFDNKRYIIDNDERLIGTLVDVYEKGDGGTIYIDRDVPERFYEGLVLSELVTRKSLKKGLSWREANAEGNKAEEEYLVAEYGAQEGKELIADEMDFQAWKFATEKKEFNLPDGTGHKVIYQKNEILPK